MRLRVKAAEGDDEVDIDDLEARLVRGKGGKGGGTRNLNKQVSLAEQRNRERREEAGAYFASPTDGPPKPDDSGPFGGSKPRSKGPFGLDVQPTPFVKPANWDEMGVIGKGWTFWAGEGGVLNNMNSLATGLSVVMGLLWIIFRFVGPTLGIYDLEASINDAPNLGI